MLMSTYSRRMFVWISTGVVAGFALTRVADAQSGKKKEEEKELEVSATEDLMREHGILRRSLLVYTFAANKLHNNSSVAPDTLQKTARLFRTFGEDYHEQKLEEAYIFPEVKKGGGRAASLVDILLQQHQRGREITDHILKSVSGTKAGAAKNHQLADALDSFVLMYRNHAAREDTIVFPAWKKTMNQQQFDEMGEKFEEIEHQQFGKDGFDDAERQIGEIENELGLNDLAKFTAPTPPGE